MISKKKEIKSIHDWNGVTGKYLKKENPPEIPIINIWGIKNGQRKDFDILTDFNYNQPKTLSEKCAQAQKHQPIRNLMQYNNQYVNHQLQNQFQRHSIFSPISQQHQFNTLLYKINQTNLLNGQTNLQNQTNLQSGLNQQTNLTNDQSSNNSPTNYKSILNNNNNQFNSPSLNYQRNSLQSHQFPINTTSNGNNQRPISPITYKWSPNTTVLTNHLLMNSGVVSRNAVTTQLKQSNNNNVTNNRFNSNTSMHQNTNLSTITSNDIIVNTKSSSQPLMNTSNQNFYSFSDASIDKVDGCLINHNNLNNNNKDNDNYLDENQQIQSYHLKIRQNHVCNNNNNLYTQSNKFSSDNLNCSNINSNSNHLLDRNFFSINDNNLLNNCCQHQLINNFDDKNSNYANAQIVQQQLKNSNYQFNSSTSASKSNDTNDNHHFNLINNDQNKDKFYKSINDTNNENLPSGWSIGYSLNGSKYFINHNRATYYNLQNDNQIETDNYLSSNWEKIIKDGSVYYFNPKTKQLIHSSNDNNSTLIEINNKDELNTLILNNSNQHVNNNQRNSQNIQQQIEQLNTELNNQQFNQNEFDNNCLSDLQQQHQNDDPLNKSNYSQHNAIVPPNPFLTERIPDWLYIYSRASVKLDHKLKWNMFNEEELNFYLAMMKRLYLEEAHEIVSKYDLLRILIEIEISNRENGKSSEFNIYDNIDNRFNYNKDNFNEENTKTDHHYSNITDLSNDLQTVTAKI